MSPSIPLEKNKETMATNLPLRPATAANNLYAAVDMGTSSFKLTLVRADPSSGRFFTLHRLKKPVLLGLDTTTTATPATLSAESLTRSTSALLSFQSYLRSHRLPPSHLRIVATSAVRESSNSFEFVNSINESCSCHVETLSGAEEARLTYLGILQFFPLFSSRVLAIDIGGGSTEFTVGFEGNVSFAQSLKLGHVTLTQQFTDVSEMRTHIRYVIESSGTAEKIKEFKIDAVVGSSGTIKAIEKAVCAGYAGRVEGNVGLFDEFVERDWKFCREDLRCLVRRLYDESEMGCEGKARMVEFFKGRARFILAGTILLDEIFEILGIEEIEVSGYALGEGVITEMLGTVYEGFDLNVNARWRSVVRLASKFNNNKRMTAATACAVISRDIFEGLRNLSDLCDNVHASDDSLMSLDVRDLEYLEAASLLHNIGLYTSKKGYRKQSYRIIMKGDHLHGYTAEEIQLVGLLVKHHTKKIPKKGALGDLGVEGMVQKFRVLSAILWLSVKLQQCLSANLQVMEVIHSPVGLKLVLSEGEEKNHSSDMAEQILSEDLNESMENELEYFRKVFNKKISITFTPSVSDGHSTT